MYGFDFEVGDTVVIRDWDDMEAEYGLDFEGDIDLPGVCFTRQMAPLCGFEGVISNIESDGIIEFHECDIPTRFLYSVFMVYHKENEPDPIEIPEADFLSVLSFE